MKRIAAAIVLLGFTASAHAQTLSARVVNAPATLVLSGLGDVFGNFATFLVSFDMRAVPVEKRTALIGEVERLVAALNELRQAKAELIVELREAETNALLRRTAPPNSLSTQQQRVEDWTDVRAKASAMNNALLVVGVRLSDSFTLSRAMPPELSADLVRLTRDKQRLFEAVNSIDPDRQLAEDDAPLFHTLIDRSVRLQDELTKVVTQLDRLKNAPR